MDRWCRGAGGEMGNGEGLLMRTGCFIFILRRHEEDVLDLERGIG